MVLQALAKWNIGRHVRRAGIPKNSPSFPCAVDFVFEQSPFRREKTYAELRKLALHPEEVGRDLEVLAQVLDHVPPDQQERVLRVQLGLKEIFPIAQEARYALQAAYGIVPAQDPYGMHASLARVLNEGDRTTVVPELLGGKFEYTLNHILDHSKSPHALVTNLVFGALLYAGLGVIYRGIRYETLGMLTETSVDPVQWRNRLEDILRRNAKERFDPNDVRRHDHFFGPQFDNAFILSVLPAVAFITGDPTQQARAFAYIERFRTQVGENDQRTDLLLQDIMFPIARAAETVEEMQLCLDEIITAKQRLTQNGLSFEPHSFNQTANSFNFFALPFILPVVSSVADFRAVVHSMGEFFQTLHEGDFDYGLLTGALRQLASIGGFGSAQEFCDFLEGIREDALRFPYRMGWGGDGYPPSGEKNIAYSL